MTSKAARALRAAPAIRVRFSPATNSVSPTRTSARTGPLGRGHQPRSTLRSRVMCARFAHDAPPTDTKSPPTYQPPRPSLTTLWTTDALGELVEAPETRGNPPTGTPLRRETATNGPRSRVVVGADVPATALGSSRAVPTPSSTKPATRPATSTPMAAGRSPPLCRRESSSRVSATVVCPHLETDLARTGASEQVAPQVLSSSRTGSPTTRPPQSVLPLTVYHPDRGHSRDHNTFSGHRFGGSDDAQFRQGPRCDLGIKSPAEPGAASYRKLEKRCKFVGCRLRGTAKDGGCWRPTFTRAVRATYRQSRQHDALRGAAPTVDGARIQRHEDGFDTALKRRIERPARWFSPPSKRRSQRTSAAVARRSTATHGRPLFTQRRTMAWRLMPIQR